MNNDVPLLLLILMLFAAGWWLGSMNTSDYDARIFNKFAIDARENVSLVQSKLDFCSSTLNEYLVDPKTLPVGYVWVKKGSSEPVMVDPQHSTFRGCTEDVDAEDELYHHGRRSLVWIMNCTE